MVIEENTFPLLPRNNEFTCTTDILTEDTWEQDLDDDLHRSNG